MTNTLSKLHGSQKRRARDDELIILMAMYRRIRKKLIHHPYVHTRYAKFFYQSLSIDEKRCRWRYIPRNTLQDPDIPPASELLIRPRILSNETKD